MQNYEENMYNLFSLIIIIFSTKLTKLLLSILSSPMLALCLIFCNLKDLLRDIATSSAVTPPDLRHHVDCGCASSNRMRIPK